jgi:hypothetical protein
MANNYIGAVKKTMAASSKRMGNLSSAFEKADRQ